MTPRAPMDWTAGRGGRVAQGLRRGRGFLALTLAFPLAACSVGPNFVTPQASVETRWKDAGFPTVKTNREDYQRWWAAFRDPTLNRLVDIAYDQNLTLMEAGARVIKARAVLGQAIGEVYPQTQQLNGTADYLQPSRTDATSNPGQCDHPNSSGGSIWAARSPGSSTCGASSATASNRPTPPISPRSPPTTTCSSP